MTFCAFPVACAATCDAGYYLDNGSCTACDNKPFYCPGDDTRHPCPTTNTNYNQFGYIFEYGTEALWAMPGAKSPSYCMCGLMFRDENGNRFLSENAFNGQNYWGTRKLWYRAGAGYYLSGYNWSSAEHWYNNVKPCTNAIPTHSHYSGPGTPDEPKSGGATDYNDCPWECDEGYGAHNGVCVALCAAGMQHLKTSTGLQFNLYPSPQSTPALAVRKDGLTCYGILHPGAATDSVNIRYNNTIYHLTN